MWSCYLSKDIELWVSGHLGKPLDSLVIDFDIIGTELPVLKKVKKFVVKSGGKRIRPITHYYFTQLLNYTGSEWEDVGAIGELIRAASLLHDAVVDNSDMRRGQPSINALHGNKTAILTGDYLLSCGLDHLRTLEPAQELLGVFTRVIRMLAVGELLQMEWETNFQLKEQVYDRIILGKTGALFGAMTEGALVLAGVRDPGAQERYRNFGERMGRLFQIRDDYLDYFGDASANGKELFQDFRRGLVTRPVILLRQSVGARERRALAELWQTEDQRASQEGLDLWFDLSQKTDLGLRLAREIEEEIHALMHFVREHPASDFQEKILENLRTLLVPVPV